MNTVKLHIGKMTCINCQNKIEKKLKNTKGISEAEVSFNNESAVIVYDCDIVSVEKIIEIIEELGYCAEKSDDKKQTRNIKSIFGAILIILALFWIIKRLELVGIFNSFPIAETDMGYWALFILGLITSVHCIAMCGGINLSQNIPIKNQISKISRFAYFRPGFLYNLGRIISYTVVGAIVGAVGSVISFDGTMKGIVQIIAGIFMIFMGLNMIGLFPSLRKFMPKMPKIFGKKVSNSHVNPKSPLYVGLLNGLMPCGPLQAMQIYALSTGDPVQGALSMFVFSVGTVPLPFIFGAASSLLSKKWTDKVMKAGAFLIIVLGISMFSYGLNLSGFNLPQIESYSSQPKGSKSIIENGVQIIHSTLEAGRYPYIIVQAGIPVKWIIDAPQGSINGCNNTMIIREYDIKHTFTQGENIIEFTPEKTGAFSYTCWMGMISGLITVISAEEFENLKSDQQSEDYNFGNPNIEPVPAYYLIPTGDDNIKIANLSGDIQTAEIEITDAGFNPSILIVEFGVEMILKVKNKSSKRSGSILLLNAYQAKADISKLNNEIRIFPTQSFDISNEDNSFYAYIKAVEDIRYIDIDAVKAEVSAHETMIYPKGYYSEACH
ncbi:MAG: sulfite exporter TauE/SafE family protein [Elusimicrobiota bacterium]|nr:sulfite exporter TauE/SafE family protein [Elusimicrobiota bacterium]